MHGRRVSLGFLKTYGSLHNLVSGCVHDAVATIPPGKLLSTCHSQAFLPLSQ